MTIAAMSLTDPVSLLSDSASLGGSVSRDDATSAAAGAKVETAATLVELSGASSMTVNDYLISVPPNMAAATALMNELSTSGNLSYAAASSVYTLLDSSATLALTSG
jgi:hypothetical protein